MNFGLMASTPPNSITFTVMMISQLDVNVSEKNALNSNLLHGSLKGTEMKSNF